MPVSEEKLAANRANAEHSSGPVTAGGKATSSQNATTHGLTGKTVVLPSEDKDEFRLFSAEVIAYLAPEGIIECEFAQMVANAQWRLRRIKTVEDGMLAGNEVDAIDPDAERRTVREAEALARCFTEKTRAFSNLSQYEHRLYRTMTNALKHIQDLQTARNKFEEAVAREANRLDYTARFLSPTFGRPDPLPPPTTPPTDGDAATSSVVIPAGHSEATPIGGFVFPTSEIKPLDEDENIAA